MEATEQFDTNTLRPSQVARYLHDLEKVNRYLLGAEAVLAHVRPRLAVANRPYMVLDLGCGGGDVLRRLAEYARAQGRSVLGTGVDRNRHALAYARMCARDFPDLDWMRADIFALPFAERSFDLVISTTLLHHLSPEEAVAFLRLAGRLAREGIVISDLVRSELAALGFRAFSRVAGFCAETRCDGAVSVRRSYRPDEMALFAVEANLSAWQVHRHPCYRMTLVGRLENGHEA